MTHDKEVQKLRDAGFTVIPPRPPKIIKVKTMSIRFEGDIYTQIQTFAAKNNLSIGAATRYLIREGLKVAE